jgi:retron-type reverse transcriptase
MKTDNRYLAVHNIGMLQRQAGVEPEVAELVVSYARLLSDAGKPMVFYRDWFTLSDDERALVKKLVQKNPGQDPGFLKFMAAYGVEMARKGLPVIFSAPHFSKIICIPQQAVAWIAANPERNYRKFLAPKKDGSMRTLYSPYGRLRSIQRWILRHILDHCPPHKCAHAYVKGRSIVSNAALHTRRRVIVRLDIRNFFPSISHATVRKIYQKIGYPYRVASLLANLCTIEGGLPQGSITSPALSNLACVRLDRRFFGMVKKMSFRYSRYADDLFFSSNNPRLPQLIPFFQKILEEEGFRLNKQKIRVMRPGQRQEVTGIVINQRPNLSREHSRRLRAAIHRLKTKGPDTLELPSKRIISTDPVQALQGHLAFLKMVNPHKARMLKG